MSTMRSMQQLVEYGIHTCLASKVPSPEIRAWAYIRISMLLDSVRHHFCHVLLPSTVGVLTLYT